MRKLNWLDMLIYRLFYWRWSSIFRERPDIKEVFMYWMSQHREFGFVDKEDIKWMMIKTKEKFTGIINDGNKK